MQAAQPTVSRLCLCRHEFHTACLVGWVQRRKYSCPVCRAVFYVPPAVRRPKR